MQILINDKNEIVSYAIIGSLEGGIDCTIPDSVLNDNPMSYKYVDGEFVKNTDYIEPLPPPPQLSIEDVTLALADLDTQRAKDKLETDLAIAELAETILNGGNA